MAAETLCRLMTDLVFLAISALFAIGQLISLDATFFAALDRQSRFVWLGLDAIVAFGMAFLLLVAVRHYRRARRRPNTGENNIKYAFIGWATYSGCLSAKLWHIYTTEILYSDARMAGHLFHLSVGLSAVVFLFLIEAHHYAKVRSPRHNYLAQLAANVTLDILDTIYFLDLIRKCQISATWNLPNFLPETMLVFGCLSFILPSVGLFKLRLRSAAKDGPLSTWYEKVYGLLCALLINLPFLVSRVYLLVHLKHADTDPEASVFLLKNLIAIYLEVRDVCAECRRKQPQSLANEIQHGATYL